MKKILLLIITISLILISSNTIYANVVDDLEFVVYEVEPYNEDGYIDIDILNNGNYILSQNQHLCFDISNNDLSVINLDFTNVTIRYLDFTPDNYKPTIWFKMNYNASPCKINIHCDNLLNITVNNNELTTYNFIFGSGNTNNLNYEFCMIYFSPSNYHTQDRYLSNIYFFTDSYLSEIRLYATGGYMGTLIKPIADEIEYTKNDIEIAYQRGLSESPQYNKWIVPGLIIVFVAAIIIVGFNTFRKE